jgi:hypothetical protein
MLNIKGMYDSALLQVEELSSLPKTARKVPEVRTVSYGDEYQ